MNQDFGCSLFALLNNLLTIARAVQWFNNSYREYVGFVWPVTIAMYDVIHAVRYQNTDISLNGMQARCSL